MFCPQCGKQVDPNSRFCPSCGAAISSPPPLASGPYRRTTPLTRSRENRMIAGLCAGFAQHFGWDLNVTRIVTFFVIFFTGIGLLVYLALWVIIPEAPYALPAKIT